MAKCNKNTNTGEKTVPISKDAAWNNAMEIMEKLIGLGLKDYQAAGIVGNMYAESRWNPTSVNPNDEGQESIGLCQWRGVRNRNLRNTAKKMSKPWTDVGVQVSFLAQELKNSYNDAYRALLEQSTVEDSANVFCCKFEVAKECYNKNCTKRPSNRIGYAKDVLAKWNSRHNS